MRNLTCTDPPAPREAEKNRAQGCHVQPCEPIPPTRVKRGVMSNRCRCQQRSGGNIGSILLRKNPATVITHGQQALFCCPHQSKAVLHSAQNSHATVQPTVELKIPGRHEEQADASSPVLPTQTWKIHVLTDLY